MMSRNIRLLLLASAALVGAVLLVAAGFGIDRAFHAGEVLRNVWVSEVELSGMKRDQAYTALQEFEDLLVTTPARFTINETEFDLDPASVGFHIDLEEAVDAALATGREGSIFEQFGWWWNHLLADEVHGLPAGLDVDALEEVAAFWESEYVADPPFDGSITVDGTTPVAEYPRTGRAVDRAAAAETVLDTLKKPTRHVEAIATATIEPALTAQDVRDALRVAERMLSGPVVLSRREPPVSVTFEVSDLAEALISEKVESSDPLLEVGFDVDAVAAFLRPLRADLELPPVDASLVINDDLTVSVVPGRPGTLIDPELATAVLEGAALSFSRQGELPFQDGAEPDLTTEEAEALGVRHLVSRFTTYHACCEDRVVNIQLFADLVDGTFVMPGESLSLNELVGQRTADRGFRPAGTIIEGEIKDTVGGGVSQFATTFYNAVFWGGYDDVEHSPHSYYFSRYPEGVEATISWPEPNLVFRNDRDSAIWIRTSHTDTSITVSFFGNNGGRMVIGEQSGGITRLSVPVQGDETAYIVEGTVSGRYNVTAPPEEYLPNPDLEPETQRVIDGGRTGWSVTVTRRIIYPDGSLDEQTWPVRYRTQAKKIQVHPCMLPESHADYVPECPEPTTTTTTTVPTTTTTAPPTTTTTTAPPTTTTTTTQG